MAFSTLNLLPIPELSPTLPLDTHYVTGIVSIIWPYSSLKRSLSLLLVDPDFRQRRNKGQVRISFRAASAKAIVKSGLTSSDKVKLGLVGVGWRQPFEAENTPGKSVDWELEYGGRLLLQIERAGQGPVILDVEDYTEESERSPLSFETNGLTPMAQKRKRESTDLYGVEVTPRVWQSPAFLKKKIENRGVRNGSIGDPFINDEDDVFVDRNGDGARKKPRFARPSEAWKYVERSPSPTPAPLSAKEVVARIEEADALNGGLVEEGSRRDENTQGMQTTPEAQAMEEVQTVQEVQPTQEMQNGQEKEVVNADLIAQEEQPIVASSDHDIGSPITQPDLDLHNLLTEPLDAPVTYPTLPVSIVPEEKTVRRERSQSPNPSFYMTGYDPRFVSYKEPTLQPEHPTNESVPHAEPVPEKLDKLTSPTAIASYYSEVDANPSPTAIQGLRSSSSSRGITGEAERQSEDPHGQSQQPASANEHPLHVIEAALEAAPSSLSETTDVSHSQSKQASEQHEDNIPTIATPLHEPNGMTPYAPPSLSPEEMAKAQRLYAMQIERRELVESSRELPEPAPTPTAPFDSSSSQQTKEDQHDRHVRFESPVRAEDDVEMLDVEIEDSSAPASNSKLLAIDTEVSEAYVQSEVGTDEEPELPQSPRLGPLPSPGLPLVSPLKSKKTLPLTAYTSRRQNGEEHDGDYEFEDNEDDDVSTPSGSEDEKQVVGQSERGRSSSVDYANSFISNVAIARQANDSEEERIEGEDEEESPIRNQNPGSPGQLESSTADADLVEQEANESQDGFRSQAELSSNDQRESAETEKDKRPTTAKRLFKPSRGNIRTENAGELEDFEGPWSSDRTESNSPVSNSNIHMYEEQGEVWSPLPDENHADSGSSDDAVNQSDFHNTYQGDDDIEQLPPDSSDEAKEYVSQQENASEDEMIPEEAIATIAVEAINQHYDQEDDDPHVGPSATMNNGWQIERKRGRTHAASKFAKASNEKGYEEDYEELYEGDYEDDEEEDYELADADEDYEYESEDEADLSPDKPIEVIDLDSDDDGVEEPIAKEAEEEALENELVVEAENDDQESSGEYYDHGAENIREQDRHELQSELQSRVEHASAEITNPDAAGGGAAVGRNTSASLASRSGQSSEGEIDAEATPLEQHSITAPTPEDQVRETLAHSRMTPLLPSQPQDNDASDEEIDDEGPASPPLAIEETRTVEVVRSEGGVIERETIQVSTTEDGLETNELVKTVSELLPSVVDPRLQNLPLTPVQSQQTQLESKSTSKLSSMQNSFNAVIPTPQPTQSSNASSFISNVQLSQNLATLLPNATPVEKNTPPPGVIGSRLKALRSSFATTGDQSLNANPYFTEGEQPLPPSSNEEEESGAELVDEDALEIAETGESGVEDEMEGPLELEEQAGDGDEDEDEDEIIDTDGADILDTDEADEETKVEGESDHDEKVVEEDGAEDELMDMDGVNEHDQAEGVVKIAENDEEVRIQGDEAGVDEDGEALESEASEGSLSTRYRRRLTPSDQLEGATPRRIAARLPKHRRSFPPSTPLTLSLRTPLAYYASLSSLPQSFGLTVSLICIVIHTTALGRSKSGPKDYYTTLYLTDSSLFTSPSSQDHSSPVITDSPAYGTRSQRRSTSIQPTVVQPSASSSKFATAQIFRPNKAALPKSTTMKTTGSVVLLRDFKVQMLPGGNPSDKLSDLPASSMHSSPNASFNSTFPATLPPPTMQLISTGSSSWAVFHPNIPPSAPPSSPRKTRSQTTISVAPSPEVSGPPIEYGEEEIDRVRALQAWWDNDIKGDHKDTLIKDVEAKVQEHEESRKESMESSRGRGRGRGRARGGRGKGRPSRDRDNVHELRDGTRWRDDGEEAADRSREMHELRDGTRYRDEEDEM